MCFIALWEVLNGPDKFVLITSFQSSSLIRGSILSLVIPALLIRISTPLSSFSIVVKAFSIDSEFATSIWIAVAVPPDLIICSTTSSAESLDEEYPTATLKDFPSSKAIA